MVNKKKKEEPKAEAIGVEVDNIVKAYPKITEGGDGTDTQDERIKE